MPATACFKNYQEMMERHKNLLINGRDAASNMKLDSAKWFVTQSDNVRKLFIAMNGSCIIRKTAVMEMRTRLKPMILKDIADLVDDISTISL
jgi:DNA-directed RNA polymerase specialized sigma54-like protein